MSRPAVKIRIFIADDHPIVRQGLRRIVEADAGMVISGEADDAAALLAGLETKATDLVLLDVSMPGGLFLETLRELRARHPSIRVLALSVHPEDEWAVRALKAGASGYLTKDHSPDQLLDAIRRVYRGGKYVSPTLAERLASQLDGGGQRAPHELLYRLSDRRRAGALDQDREHVPHSYSREDGGRHQRRSGPLCRPAWADCLRQCSPSSDKSVPLFRARLSRRV